MAQKVLSRSSAIRGVPDAVAQVRAYHQRTKHMPGRYSPGPGDMDWANQPDPFRRFSGTSMIELPLVRDEDTPPYDALFEFKGTPPLPLTAESLGLFLELSLGLTAWKEFQGTRWALRSNPSSGNLHPTEGYAVLPALATLSDRSGVYHYAPREHALKQRCVLDEAAWSGLAAGLPADAFLVGLTSVHWREAWKYGERAFRYCQHDVGHAIGAARIAAATLGWRLVLLEGLADQQVQELLGIGRKEDFANTEGEHPDCLAVVWPADETNQAEMEGGGTLPLFLDPDAVEALARSTWHGQANRLSRDNPAPWEIIDEAALASWKTEIEHRLLDLAPDRAGSDTGERWAPEDQALYPSEPPAGRIIRQRRSAVAFDGKTSISAASFFTMMARVTPRVEQPVMHRPMPWDAITWTPRIHLAVFAHRIEGLPSGLYVLVRDPAKQKMLQEAMHREFLWVPAAGCPPDVPLWLLQEGDARRLAAQVSCHQDIAGDSAFSLGMIAEFEPSLRTEGPWFYRRLFWETGILGQVLYLEAEAAGVRATGIGCFFDDPVHEALGVKDLTLQSLYHFTTGGHVEDRRLTTLPPYPTRKD